MKIKIIDAKNALDTNSVEHIECMNVQILVGNKKFNISCENEHISISVENTLMIEPRANNRIYLTEIRR